MKKLNYYTLDVFTDERFKGNPLAVVQIDEPLELDLYYQIAREFGYSETSFIYYSNIDKALKVRSFTPGNYEVAGAGHNLLGVVSLALIKEWDIFREQADGPFIWIGEELIRLKTEILNTRYFVGMRQRPANFLTTVPPAKLADSFQIPVEGIGIRQLLPTVVQTEVAHLMVPVRDRDTLTRAAPDNKKLEALSRAYGFEGFYLFTDQPREKEFIAETRFFNPAFGINEDPATGTAAAPLAGLLAKMGAIEKNKKHQLLQGVLTGHTSKIQVEVQDAGIWVSGSSEIVMEGQLYF